MESMKSDLSTSTVSWRQSVTFTTVLPEVACTRVKFKRNCWPCASMWMVPDSFNPDTLSCRIPVVREVFVKSARGGFGFFTEKRDVSSNVVVAKVDRIGCCVSTQQVNQLGRATT